MNFCAHIKADIIRQRVDEPGRHANIFGQPTVMIASVQLHRTRAEGSVAHHRRLRTHLFPIGEAVIAMPTSQHRVYANAPSQQRAIRFTADDSHGARNLVPGGGRQVLEEPSLEQLHHPGSNSRRGDADEHILRSEFRYGDVFEPQLFCPPACSRCDHVGHMAILPHRFCGCWPSGQPTRRPSSSLMSTGTACFKPLAT
jgi:hypothetical protein